MDFEDNDPMEDKTVLPKVAAPSIRIIAGGGCGTNIVRLARDEVKHLADIRILDTSYANLRTNELDMAHVITENKSGAGKIRGEHLHSINQYISGLPNEDLVSTDITVLVFALGGGTGSVVGPIAIKEIGRRKGTIPVAFIVVDTISEKDVENTYKTLQSLENICKEHNIYLPVVLFDNSVGKEVVNKAMRKQLIDLVNLVTLPTIETDRNDRKNWLDGNKTSKAGPGLKPLHIVSGNEISDIEATGEIWRFDSNYIYDAILSIDAADAYNTVRPRSRIRFDGTFTTVINTPLVGIVGGPTNIYETIVSDIKNAEQQFKAQSRAYTPMVEIDKNDVDDTGLII